MLKFEKKKSVAKRLNILILGNEQNYSISHYAVSSASCYLLLLNTEQYYHPILEHSQSVLKAFVINLHRNLLAVFSTITNNCTHKTHKTK